MPYIEGHFDNECDGHSSEDHSGMNHQPVVMWCLSNYQHEMSHMVLVPPWHRGTPAVNSRLGVLRGLSFNSPCLHFRLFASLLFSQVSVPCLLPSLSWWQRCLCSIFRFRNVTATLCRYARICTDIHSFLSEWNVLSSHLFLWLVSFKFGSCLLFLSFPYLTPSDVLFPIPEQSPPSTTCFPDFSTSKPWEIFPSSFPITVTKSFIFPHSILLSCA